MVVGVVLVFRPFTSLGVLVALVAATFILTGIGELAGAPQSPTPWLARLGGVAWIAVGVAAAAWSGITIHALTILVGISLIVGGVARLVEGVRGVVEERLIAALGGLASIVFGVLALAWKDVTVLVLALFVGARTILFGFDLIAAALGRGPLRGSTTHAPTPQQRRRAHRRRLLGAVGALVLALALLGISAGIHRGSHAVDAFYNPPQGSASKPPGVLLRSRPFTRGVPSGARAWLILYTTTRDDHTPAVASALVVAAEHLPAGPRPVIAWAHGTTGVARPCAPSLLQDPFAAGSLPALSQVITRGWVLVATDYVGLGTPGPHPYLIGQGEARSVLDSVRAARQLPALTLANRTIVWGHSQGGNAALWTGILGPSYAPDVHLAGVAALAPASNLTALVSNLASVQGGAIVASYTTVAYSEIYSDVSFNAYVRPTARTSARELAGRCLAHPEALVSAATSLALRRSLFATDPTTGAFGARLHENTPSEPIAAPLLIAQGQDDSLVLPSVQAQYVAQLCRHGETVQYRTYAGRGHTNLVAEDSPLIPALLLWTGYRLGDKRQPAGCHTIAR